MPYPAITSRRIPYDIDGSAVGFRSGSFESGISSWLSSENKSKINNENTDVYGQEWTSGALHTFWFFFTESREIETLFLGISGSIAFQFVKGSNDTANGVDGTWETATFPNGVPSLVFNLDSWRNSIKPISFSGPKKVICVQVRYTSNSNWGYVYKIHFYGRKASGEAADDILFTDTNGNELTALMEWGDRPEGTTVIKSFKVKNASSTKIANNVNLQLNHADFLMSLDQANWVATLDIASIPANSLSAEVFVKNSLGVPPLTLGPRAARIIATVGSFT